VVLSDHGVSPEAEFEKAFSWNLDEVLADWDS
jgi:hypothetical protein